MGADLMNIGIGSEKFQTNEADKPVITDMSKTDNETDNVWDFYIQTLSKQERAKAYEVVTNRLPAFLEFQAMTPGWIKAKKELEQLRKLEYDKLTEEEKKQIETLQVSGNNNGLNDNTIKYEELTDEQKNLIYLSPEYLFDSKPPDKLVYIHSYRSFPPVIKTVHKYGYICVNKGKCETADVEQTANEAILSVVESWEQKEDQKTQREVFKNAVQNKIKRNFQMLLEKTAPGFTSDWRHYIIRKTIEEIEKEAFVKYCSYDTENILTELAETVNRRLRHVKEYKVKAIKTVLQEREQRFGEVSLEQQIDEAGSMRLSGFNYDTSNILESPEELVIRQIEYEAVINSIQSAKDRNIIKLIEYGYRTDELEPFEGLTGAAVRKRLSRLRKKLRSSRQ
ncbi:MAG: hypothetical protein J6M57_00170 [Acidaminococcaceae bacterium]|nr:hypothetical protein [Acidaminococcaceae bacterium]